MDPLRTPCCTRFGRLCPSCTVQHTLKTLLAFHAAGFPAGVINVITGKGSEIGDYLVQHPAVKCISFTGGDTGLEVSRKAAMVPLQMELGGKVRPLNLPTGPPRNPPKHPLSTPSAARWP
eukprot:1178319-Prorocentrum_minimum.AAC.3